MSINSIWKIAAIVTNVHKLYTEKYCYHLCRRSAYKKMRLTNVYKLLQKCAVIIV